MRRYSTVLSRQLFLQKISIVDVRLGSSYAPEDYSKCLMFIILVFDTIFLLFNF